MRVTVTPTGSQTLREIAGSQGLEYEWAITWQIDGERGLNFAVTMTAGAQAQPQAVAKTLTELQRFLRSASREADNYQV